MAGGGLHVGTFTIDRDADSWEYEAAARLDDQPLIFKLELADKGVLSRDVVYEWLVARAPERHYAMIFTLLERIGIKEYNPLAFVVYNRGKFNTDTFYLEPESGDEEDFRVLYAGKINEEGRP
jgi:hypothetical protein